MRQRVIHLMRPRAGLAAVVAMCWFWVVPVVDAATARAELKDARGTKVGGATLVDTPEGVKISARFTDCRDDRITPESNRFRSSSDSISRDSRCDSSLMIDRKCFDCWGVISP